VEEMMGGKAGLGLVLIAVFAAGLVTGVVATNLLRQRQEQEEEATRFNLVLRYGVGAKNVLHTFNGTFTKDMIRDPSITVPLRLSRDEMSLIYSKMIQTRFLTLTQEWLDNAPYEDNETRRVSPSRDYSLRVRYGSVVKELNWDDNTIINLREVTPLRELVDLIVERIHSHEEYAHLPEPQGGYA
jgi:hypothetical protein